MVPTNSTTTKKKNRKMTGKDYKLLQKRVSEMRHQMLMDEPCPLYEPGWEDVTNSPADWADFWENEDAA
tara:strand:- start:9 stop:215 length:207 start_codon:yes stop_codon:yes gene_type:complete